MSGANLRFQTFDSHFAFNSGDPEVTRMIIQSGGNVGIGTTGPTQRLDVASGNIALGHNLAATNQVIKTFATGHAAGNVPSQLDFIIQDGAPAGISIRNVRDGTFNSQSIEFLTHHGGVSAGTRMVIDRAGNVGIGTSAPAARLQNVGDLYITSSINRGQVVSDTVFGTLKIGANLSGSFGAGIRGVQMAGLWSDNVRLDLTTTTTWNDLTQTPRLSVMPITGNVGIGTTAPGARLHVAETGVNVEAVRVGDTRRMKVIPNLGAGGFNPLSQAGDMGLIFTAGNLVIAPWSASPAGIRITNTGNVGIGTVNPGARLEVAGNIIAAPPTASNHVATRGWVEALTGPAFAPLIINSTGVANVSITGTHPGMTNYLIHPIAAGTAVSLTAPATAGGFPFRDWTGCDSVTGTTCNLTMTGARTVNVSYLIALNINSSGAAGVVITSATGHGGTTNYSLILTSNTIIALTAPATAGGLPFHDWVGCDSVTGTTCNLTINATRTVTARYLFANFLFASSTTHGGNTINNRANANNICRNSTTRPAICAPERTWAFISFSGTDEIRDFPTTVPAWTGGVSLDTTRPWYWRQGTHLGARADNNWAALLDGSILNNPTRGGLPGVWHWTGSAHDGALAPNCGGWLSATGSGWGAGGRGSTDSTWLGQECCSCTHIAPLYCACF